MTQNKTFRWQISDQAGEFLGLTDLAIAGSDALNAAAPGRWLGYTALFVFGAVCTFASMFLLQKI